MEMREIDLADAGSEAGSAGSTDAKNDDELTAVRYLQSIYRDPMEPTGVRMRAAKDAAPYEQPQLRAVAMTTMDQQSFAAALERAIMRSKSPPPVAALPPPEQHSASELKGNFPTRRRNLR
jgi:hypothetical protein